MKHIVGKFIALEGPDFSGKSTLAGMTVGWLKDRSVSAVLNAEPTWGLFGKLIRTILKGETLKPDLLGELGVIVSEVLRLRMESEMENFWNNIVITIDLLKNALAKGTNGKALNNFLTVLQEQSFFFADSFFDLQNFIIPHLDKGDCVVQDRFRLSGGAYGLPKGLTPEQFLELQNEALGPFYRQPDVTFIIEIPAEVSIARQICSGQAADSNENLHYLSEVGKAYRQLLEFLNSNGRSYNAVFIDGNRPIEQVFSDITKELEPLFVLR